MTKKRRIETKENFEISAKCEAFYTGGKIQVSSNGQFILSSCLENIKLFDIANGKTCNAVESFEGEEISAFLLAEDDSTFVTASKNGIMRLWNLSTKEIKKTWKSVHIGPVSCLAFDSTTTLLATGGSDSTVKVWDIIKKYYTHNLKGGKGVFSKVSFHTIGSELHVFGTADDYEIHIWNLHTNKLIASLSGHFSTVTEFIFLEDNKMLSSSRDKVVLYWDLSTFKLLKTIPVYETIESCFLVPPKLSLNDVTFSETDTYFVTAGDKGILKIWSVSSGLCVFEQSDSVIVLPEDSSYEDSLIIQAVYSPALEAVVVVTFEQNIILYSLNKFYVKNQFVGYNDDVLSVKFVGKKDNRIAVATNSSQIKLFNFPSFSCQLLKGHQDIVLSLDVFRKHKHILVSGSKDNNVKVWFLSSDSTINAEYTGYGHTDSVSAVCCCKGKGRFFASGSEDTTLKLWEVPENKPLVATKLLLSPYCTTKAHDKHINAIDISDNDKLVVTGSQDHTAKIWDSTDLSLLGTLRGHKKGVWSVKFSPVDLVLATSSGDETIRIWSIMDFSCLKVFQGHEATVLQVMFLSRGTQLLSSASDGNIKLWDIKTNLCVKTLSEHQVRVWTIASSYDEEYMVSGGADSNIIIWKDTTKLEKEKSVAEKEDYILQEQELSNLVLEEKWNKALGLAITLDKPYQAYNIIKEIIYKTSGEEKFKKVFLSLRQDQQESLLKFSIEWITNAKTCHPGVMVLNLVYNNHDCEELLKLPNIASYVRDALPYLDRHFKRLNKRCQDMQILNFLCSQYKVTNHFQSQDTSTEV